MDNNRVYQTQKGDYDYLLPSFNFNIEMLEDVFVRAAFSQTIGRPDYTSIQGGTTVGTLAYRNGGSGSAGNPSLLPLSQRTMTCRQNGITTMPVTSQSVISVKM